MDQVNREESVEEVSGKGPALANAEIGIAMDSGLSITMESYEFVIIQNDLNKLYGSYDLGVVFDEGSTILVILHSFRLLKRKA